jgi:hypothetical protein
MGAGMGLTCAFLQAHGAGFASARAPLVTGLATDVVEFASRDDRQCVSQVVCDTLQLLVHR